MKNSSPFVPLILATAFFLSSCRVSDQWAPRTFSQISTVNHATPRPTASIPVAHPVPAPQWASAAVARPPAPFQVPVPHPRPVPQATALRQSRPSWGQPVQSLSGSRSSPQHHVTPAPTPPPVRVAATPRAVSPVKQVFVTSTATPPSPIRPSTRGKVRLVNGLAVAPPDAPLAVRRAVAAGNRLQKLPYKWGGGHAKLNDTGYDCSGAVSYVLREAGLLKDQLISSGFLTYGEPGEGDWITVWSKNGHTFIFVGGLRLDTGGSSRRTGPRWKPEKRSFKGFQPRHPRGF